MRPGRRAWDLLEGAIDLHVHPSPSRRQRHGDAWDLAELAASRGMAGLLLKDHDRSTIGDAAIVSRHGRGPRAYSSICCNVSMGGINPSVVRAALDLGVSLIFLPTNSALNDHVRSGESGGPESAGGDDWLTALRDGVLTADTAAIIAVAAEHGVPVATGHLSAVEIDAVIAHAGNVGARVIVTHAPVFTGAGLDALARWVDAGATLELAAAFCAGGLVSRSQSRTIEADAEIIETVGPAHVVLSSDLGFAAGPTPVDGLVDYLSELLAAGIPDTAVREMTSRNPRALIDPTGKDAD
jgi:hypothetical protein